MKIDSQEIESEYIEIDIDNQETSEVRYALDIIVDKGQAPLRIDKFVMSRMEDVTRNKIQQAIEENILTVNGEPIKANYKVRPLDIIKMIDTRSEESLEILPEDIMPPIIFEDDNLMIINKPAGMVVHPGCGNRTSTLLHGLAYYYENSNSVNTLNRFGLLHRIDKNTSGLLVIAKSELALQKLQKQFFHHSISRKYWALVWGDVDGDFGTIIRNVGRHPRFRKQMTTFDEDGDGKLAITHYKVLERFGYVTLVECELETGRTHQIRVHMKYIGHPLFNDENYGGDQILKGTIYTKYKQFVENCFKLLPRQALHAKTLGFEHPSTGEQVNFEIPLPEDFHTVLEKWRTYSKAKFED